MTQRGSVHAMFHRLVPAARVGASSLFSHAVFIETKTEEQVQVQVVLFVVRNITLFRLHKRQSGKHADRQHNYMLSIVSQTSDLVCDKITFSLF